MSKEIKYCVFSALALLGLCLIFAGMWMVNSIVGTIITGIICLIVGCIGVFNAD